MSEHEHTEPERDERTEDVEDLEVPADQAEDVEGGFAKIKSKDDLWLK